MKFMNLGLSVLLGVTMLTGVNLFTSPAWSADGNADSGGHFMYENENEMIRFETQKLALKISGISQDSWDLRMSFAGVRDLKTLTQRSLIESLLKPVEHAPLEDGEVVDENGHHIPRDFGYSLERKSLIAFRGFYANASRMLDIDSRGQVAPQSIANYIKLRDNLYFLLLTEAMHLHGIGITKKTTSDAETIAKAILGYGNSQIQNLIWVNMHDHNYCGVLGDLDQRQKDCNVVNYAKTVFNESNGLITPLSFSFPIVSRSEKYSQLDLELYGNWAKHGSKAIFNSQQKLGFLIGYSDIIQTASGVRDFCQHEMDTVNASIQWDLPNEQQAQAIMQRVSKVEVIIFKDENNKLYILNRDGKVKMITSNVLKRTLPIFTGVHSEYEPICVGKL